MAGCGDNGDDRPDNGAGVGLSFPFTDEYSGKKFDEKRSSCDFARSRSPRVLLTARKSVMSDEKTSVCICPISSSLRD